MPARFRGHGRVHRLLPLREIAPAGSREQDIACEPSPQIFGGQHFQPRCRKLEGERQGIEPSTNLHHGRAVRRCQVKVRLDVPHALEE